MSTDSGAMLIVVWIPLFVVWAVVVVDVLRRRDLGTARKAIWILVCTLLWPALIAYLLLRPTRGRLEDPEMREDVHARLVNAALQHEAGEIDAAELAEIVQGLRTR